MLVWCEFASKIPPPNAALLVIWPAGFLSRHGKREKPFCLRLLFHFSRLRASPSRSKARPLMSKTFRRFEILLPLRFNDGTAVPEDLIAETLLELRDRFGAVSAETQTIRGVWQHEGKVYRDDLIRVFVDVPDSAENLGFFQTFKEHAKDRFKQLDIWMTTYPIEVL